MQLIANTSEFFGRPLEAPYSEIVDPDSAMQVREYFSVLADYHPTPLLALKELSGNTGVGRVWYKDEGGRLGLNSFKALGGAYAVARVVHAAAERALNDVLPIRALRSGPVAEIAAGTHVCCATDGNHGLSVAWGASLLGCPCTVFIHENVSRARESAIAAYGAEVVRVPGVYDDSVRHADAVSKAEGWVCVTDVTTQAYDEITAHVMKGYTLIADECIRDLQGTGGEPTHVFLQGGVGGLAAAVGGCFKTHVEPAPKVIVVEPERANCILESARKGAPARIPPGHPTCMEMLECYEPSHVAWKILQHTADFFMDISEESVTEAMQVLHDCKGSCDIDLGVSGAVGLAGFLTACGSSGFRNRLELNEQSSVLLIGTERSAPPTSQGP